VRGRHHAAIGRDRGDPRRNFMVERRSRATYSAARAANTSRPGDRRPPAARRPPARTGSTAGHRTTRADRAHRSAAARSRSSGSRSATATTGVFFCRRSRSVGQLALEVQPRCHDEIRPRAAGRHREASPCTNGDRSPGPSGSRSPHDHRPPGGPGRRRSSSWRTTRGRSSAGDDPVGIGHHQRRRRARYRKPEGNRFLKDQNIVF